MKKICIITNYGSHYRQPIYKMLDSAFDCTFSFGNECEGSIKKMDYSQLSNVEEHSTKRFGPFLYQKGISRYCRENYDAIIATGVINDIGVWQLLIAARIHRKKVYLWTHGWYGREGFFKKCVKRVFFGLASGVLTYGNYARNLMIENGYSPDKVTTIYNALDYDTQLSYRKKIVSTGLYANHFSNNNPNIIYMGRLHARKKLDMILQVAKKASDAGHPFNVTFIGGGSSESDLQSLSESLELNDLVWFYGPCYEEKLLSELIYDADVCVSPGDVGLTSIHCLMYGCPIITHDNFTRQMPEFEAIKDGVTGAFYKYGDLESLYETLSYWLEHTDREKVRAAAYKEIDENWNPHNQIRIFKDLIGRI